MIDTTHSPLLHLGQHLRIFFIVMGLIFVCSSIGILTRPLDLLAYFWPANAVLLGIFMRFPALRSVCGWLGASIGFLGANVLLNGGFEINVYMSLANLITVAVTLTLIDLFKLDYQQYQQGVKVPYLIVLCILLASMAASTFAILTIPHVNNTFLTGQPLWQDFGMWWSAEMINMLMVLPVILTLPSRAILTNLWNNQRRLHFDWVTLLPLFGVILSIVCTHFFFGPGALLFPIAALIWTALSYPIFLVTLINFVVCMFLYQSATLYYLNQSAELYLSNSISIRIGLCMLLLGPLTLAVISAARKILYKQILYLANHDSLTHAMTRRHFLEQADQIVYQTLPRPHSISIFLMDLDFFKKINDQYGHYVGDRVLERFSQIVRNNLREDDLFGRLGGEEFAILLTNLTRSESKQIAERIRRAVEQATFQLEEGRTLTISVSIGIYYQIPPFNQPFIRLLKMADEALYHAKGYGRNQVYLKQQESK